MSSAAVVIEAFRVNAILKSMLQIRFVFDRGSGIIFLTVTSRNQTEILFFVNGGNFYLHVIL